MNQPPFSAAQQDLPREDFPNSAPYRTLTPYMVTLRAPDLMDFMRQVFGAEERLRHAGSEGGVHIEAQIGDSILMLGGGPATQGRQRPAALHVYVDDCDAIYRRALEAGAESLGEPGGQSYGERAGFVRDPHENRWYIATRLPEAEVRLEARSTVTPFVHPRHTPVFLDFLDRAFGAVKLAQYDESGRTSYAAVRLGDSILEMTEAHPGVQPLSSMFYLYVRDADAAYRRAVGAGASSISPPADQPYGDRNAGVRDPFGHEWYVAARLS